MEIDLYNNTKALLGLSVQDITTDTTTSGEIIDTKGFESLVFAIHSGTITDGTYTFTVWESDDSGMSGATVTVSPENLGTSAAYVAANDDEVRRLGSVGKLRYQQLRCVSASTTTGGTNFVASAILGHPKTAPVAAQSA